MSVPIATREMVKPWRAGYLARSAQAVFKQRVTRSREIIADFFERGLNTRVMWSAGKDSTVLVHIAHQVSSDMHAASEKDDLDFPGEKEYVQHVADKYGFALDIIEPPFSLWDRLEGVDATEDLHSRGTAFSDGAFYDLLDAYHRREGVEAIMMGLRKHESRGRYMNRLARGHAYQKKDGMWVCNPLVDWEAQDVFAYLISRKVPILDVYFKTRFVGGPESIRKSWAIPGQSAQWGQAAWLRYYYPALFNKLCETNPELKRFT